MTAEDLKAEITIELEAMRQLAAELESLRRDVAGREPSVREKTAAAAFLAQFYTGIENILKRLSRFHAVTLPSGENWHFDLYKRFCFPGHPPLPVLFDQELATRISPFRRFRHVVHHGYGFQIEWDRMREGVHHVADLLVKFRDRVQAHLETI